MKWLLNTIDGIDNMQKINREKPAFSMRPSTNPMVYTAGRWKKNRVRR
jgi:hypothetical protein